ncbi:MAG: TasA family protein [Candidatus Parcubacteria bacterium]|nr:TasA family protein [Candidatus Parcubacteria bacterium]
MNKKIILSLGVIGIVAAFAIGGTVAYFSDTETSTGNTFTAGAIDLKVSNESYVSNQTTGVLEASPNTSWVSGATIGKFFNFSDVKPGDVGEDTIGLTVENNDAWACATLELKSNKDNTCTGPEMKNDTNCVVPGTDWDGDLAQGIEFVWWADDGDNVLETNEEATKYYLGPASITTLLGEDKKLELTVADSILNFFNPTTGGPLKGMTTYNLGKGWCFGHMTLHPIPEDTTGPLVRGTGFSCDGASVTNAAQTDSLTADLTFTAIQARNNMAYKCPEHQPKTKLVVSSNIMIFGSTGWGGLSCPSDYPNVISGGVSQTNTEPWVVNTYPVSFVLAKTGATLDGSIYPNFPHHNYPGGEQGIAIHNGVTGQSLYAYLTCQAN